MIELRFNLKGNISTDRKKVVIMFIENWIYSVVDEHDVSISLLFENILSIQLLHYEDAIAIQLHGVPQDLTKFIESHELRETV